LQRPAYGPPVAIEDAYELAYREAVRALEHQRAALSELRGRASMLLAAAAIALSLLGRQTLATPLAWAAIITFALLSICVVVIVWPHGELLLDLDPYVLLAAHLSARDPATAGLTLDLIAHMASSRRANVRRLVHVAHAFRTGACLLAIQMVLTILAIAATV
jgi:hypothetical protein